MNSVSLLYNCYRIIIALLHNHSGKIIFTTIIYGFINNLIIIRNIYFKNMKYIIFYLLSKCTFYQRWMLESRIVSKGSGSKWIESEISTQNALVLTVGNEFVSHENTLHSVSFVSNPPTRSSLPFILGYVHFPLIVLTNGVFFVEESNRLCDQPGVKNVMLAESSKSEKNWLKRLFAVFRNT